MKKILPLLLLLPGFACFGQKVALSLNLKKDSVYHLKSINTVIVKQNIQGQQVDVNTTINADIANKVVAIRDSVYAMQVSYVNMQMVINAMGQTMAFGSDDKGDTTGAMGNMGAMMGNMLKAMTNKPFLMELSKTGHVL